MTPEAVIDLLTARHAGLIPTESWGETALFYNPDRRLPRGVYFATVKVKDGENDRASGLDRAGVFRLSFGLTPRDYERLFGPRPKRPVKGGVIAGDWPFTETDRLMPHPVYGWMGWAAVLCPTQRKMAEIAPLIASSHAKAQAAFEKRAGGAP